MYYRTRVISMLTALAADLTLLPLLIMRFVTPGAADAEQDGTGSMETRR